MGRAKGVAFGSYKKGNVICVDCGATFKGNKKAERCHNCRAERRLYLDRERSRK